MIEAFPWDEAPRYLLRDRDAIYGAQFQQRIGNMDIEEVKIAPRSPWQNPYVERVIGSIRRDMIAHVVVLNERHLLRVLRSYASYYRASRTHRALDGDSPDGRAVEPPELGEVVAHPQVGGIHHRYARRAA